MGNNVFASVFAVRLTTSRRFDFIHFPRLHNVSPFVMKSHCVPRMSCSVQKWNDHRSLALWMFTSCLAREWLLMEWKNEHSVQPFSLGSTSRAFGSSQAFFARFCSVIHSRDSRRHSTGKHPIDMQMHNYFLLRRLQRMQLLSNNGRFQQI